MTRNEILQNRFANEDRSNRGCRKTPRWTKIGGVLLVAWSCSRLAHGELLHSKDLSFPQIAAGPGFQSVITITNRGSAQYRGLAEFWTGHGQAWNPQVNGLRITSSRLDLVVPPEATMILRISDDLLIPGAVTIRATSPAFDNFIEGTLLYSYQDQQYDSVGIAPAVELYSSVIPFEDFESVGLALANPHPGSLATVKLLLIDANGIEQESVVREFPGRSHEARFLSEIFSTTVGSGKVQVESTEPILGTAVTLVQGEISALPMNPSPVAYTVYFRYQGKTDQAEVVLWAEGAFVNGYLRFLILDGRINANPALYVVSGELHNHDLRMTLFGAGPTVGVQETINTLKVLDFSFERLSFKGGFTRIFPWLVFPSNQVLGNYEMIRKD